MPRPPISSYVSTYTTTCIRIRSNIYMYQRIPTYTCTNMYMYTYQHIHAPTYINKHTYHHIHIHIPTSRTSILHTRIIKFCPYMVLECCHEIRTGMPSQHSKLTCTRSNSTTIFIPRIQERNNRNPSTISIIFLHTICRPLQIASVHY